MVFSPYAIAGIVIVLGGLKYLGRVMRKSRNLDIGLNLSSPRARKYAGPFEGTMTRREACLILGVRESTPEDKILSAHKKLMLLNHPDNGGSTFLATKINEAKEVILKK